MAKSFSRVDRVAADIQRVLADVIRAELEQFQSGMITITRVKVTADLSFADIHFSVLSTGGIGDDPLVDNDERDDKRLHAHLKKNRGMLRAVVAKELNLRSTPELRFHLDKTQTEGNKLLRMIEQQLKSSSDGDNE